MNNQSLSRKCLGVLLASGLTACAPQPIYYWGDFEAGLYDRYVDENPAQADVYLLETITTAEQERLKVPPGAYADYGFVLFRRGDRQGAIAYFEKEKQLFPESGAFMTKLIERVNKKTTEPLESHTMPMSPVPGEKP